MCCKLLRRNPERRLGSGEKDAEDVKKQPFFKVSRNQKCEWFFFVFFSQTRFSDDAVWFRIRTGRLSFFGKSRRLLSRPSREMRTSATLMRSLQPRRRPSRRPASDAAFPERSRIILRILTMCPTSARVRRVADGHCRPRTQRGEEDGGGMVSCGNS